MGAVLAAQYKGVDLGPILALLAVHGELVQPTALPERLCDDPDDDKFMGCAVAGGARVVVSGDKGLRRVSGWKGIEVIAPRTFADRYL